MLREKQYLRIEKELKSKNSIKYTLKKCKLKYLDLYICIYNSD